MQLRSAEFTITFVESLPAFVLTADLYEAFTGKKQPEEANAVSKGLRIAIPEKDAQVTAGGRRIKMEMKELFPPEEVVSNFEVFFEKLQNVIPAGKAEFALHLVWLKPYEGTFEELNEKLKEEWYKPGIPFIEGSSDCALLLTLRDGDAIINYACGPNLKSELESNRWSLRGKRNALPEVSLLLSVNYVKDDVVSATPLSVSEFLGHVVRYNLERVEEINLIER